MTDFILRNVEIDGRTGLDVLLRAGAVAQVGKELEASERCEIVDGNGCALIPGLHDHHIHLHALAADRVSVRCGPPDVTSSDDLARTLASAPGDGWIRGVGYFESVAGMLDSEILDRLQSTRPVRIQHRSGALWILNSVAARLARLDTADHPGVERNDAGHPTGRIWRADTWLRERLPATTAPELDSIGAELARYGITGVTDATPDLPPSTVEALMDAHATGAIPQRLHLLGAPSGFRPSEPHCTVGPYKIVIADSALPDIDDLVCSIRRVHAAGRAVAVHCVSREAFVILLAALDEAGLHRGDRIEHGALVPAESIDDLRRRGIHVVTQPGFLADRGDAYLRDVDPTDLPDLYRCRSLIDGGVPLALSSDAPYGPVDPWEVMVATVTRRCPTGDVVGAVERITPPEALDRYLAPLDDPGGPARHVTIGAEADLVLLDGPLTEVLDDPDARRVRATWIGGRCVYSGP
ncbi:amidohydrolase family protein [Rhodococcus sp. HNM0563]|uniref:amidohydrolase family protein n=1 Tax=Rhodococcus sp. HNM0563 TaxID=2716339 RepID=UPI00146AA3AE|nr:amidohydrolase family protein [Rhodococcus sp. HNM0563]NLU61929.1 amidohydrolase family protein [Rhodococcus sp. HNM0563]